MRNFVSIAITIMLVFGAGIANAQGYTFRVLANKGQNKVKKSGTATAVALKTGATLSDGDELIASQGAYIGLMHKSGKTLEVRTPGAKKVSELSKLVNTKSASVTSRYAKFLSEKMNEKGQPGYRQKLNATGAADRGSAGTIDVLLFEVENAKVVGNNAIVSWDDPKEMPDATYVVTVQNIFDEEIFKSETDGNAVSLDFTSDQMKNDEGLYIVSVATKENPDISSKKYGIMKLSGDDAAAYTEGLDELKSEVPEDSPLGKVIYASYYEENGLVLDALTAIEEAIQMNPEVEDFKVMRKDIIERNGIKVYEEK